jgi:MipA family protein
MWIRILLCLLFASAASAQESSPENIPENSEALWEYGVGVGYIRLPHYPASNQYKDVVLPFPTFQYRGDILRADDRDGARAYLFKTEKSSIELGGAGYSYLDSDDNDARSGMEDLMWNLQLGPQWVYHPNDELEFQIGLYQAIATDFVMTRRQGFSYEAEVIYHIDEYLQNSGQFGSAKMQGRVSLQLKAGDRDFLAPYFDVSSKFAKADRPAYEARAGFLSTTFTYFQAAELDRWTLYAGFSDSHYGWSVNRESPLHKLDRNFSIFAGVTYRLSESTKQSVPIESTEGVINKLRSRKP